jgi:integrase
MPRLHRPFLRRGWYVSKVLGTLVRLCPAADGVKRAAAELARHLAGGEPLVASPLLAILSEAAPLPLTPAAGPTVSDLIERFLTSVAAEKAADTYTDYERWCREFAKLFGKCTAAALTRADALAFRQHLLSATWKPPKGRPRTYKPKTVNNALIATRRLFNWAVDAALVAANPFARTKLLPTRGRTRVLTADEFERLLAASDQPAFRDVLVVMRHTAARPQDIYSMSWDMVDLAAGLVTIAVHKGSRTARTPKPRVLGIPPCVGEVLKRRMGARGASPLVFLNSRGTAWRKDSLGLAMRRARERAKLTPDAAGERVVLYTNRHTFLTAAGADPTISQSTLAEIAGHTSPVTTARYVHAARQSVAAAAVRASKHVEMNSPSFPPVE